MRAHPDLGRGTPRHILVGDNNYYWYIGMVGVWCHGWELSNLYMYRLPITLAVQAPCRAWDKQKLANRQLGAIDFPCLLTVEGFCFSIFSQFDLRIGFIWGLHKETKLLP